MPALLWNGQQPFVRFPACFVLKRTPMVGLPQVMPLKFEHQQQDLDVARVAAAALRLRRASPTLGLRPIKVA